MGALGRCFDRARRHKSADPPRRPAFLDHDRRRGQTRVDGGVVTGRRGDEEAGNGEFENAVHRHTSAGGGEDRKSTRLNSSHTVISYAVFCLKKKKENKKETP